MTQTAEQLPITAPPLRIADLPLDEQPSNRLDAYGPQCLSDSELLALLLDCESIEEARRIAQATRNGGDVTRFTTKKQSRRYRAALELHRRLTLSDIPERERADAETIGRRLVTEYGSRQQEHLVAVLLNSREQILRVETVYVGTINTALVSTRDVARLALEHGAASVVLSHNHPSGDPSPSAEDLMFTRKMKEALQTLDIELSDHIVTSRHRYYSMNERGQL